MATTAPPIPRLELALTPTPLLPLERLSRDVGVELWVKRDDLTGLAESGNDVRKLEFLLGEATTQGADTLITAGAVQSNAGRAVAAVAARLGMRAVLVVRGEPPATLDGNLLLGALFGADIRYMGGATSVDETLEDIAVDVRAAGGAPYVIRESEASVAGALGYVACAQELHAQIRHGAPDFDSLVVTTVTGASQAGLLMGIELTGLRARVVGVPVARDAARVRDAVRGIIARAARKYGLPVSFADDVALVDGGRDAAVRREDLDTVVRVARAEGLVLDPAHTAKAFAGLLDALRDDPHRFGRRVCFVHTGGLFGLFPFRDELTAMLGPGGAGRRW